MNEAQGTAFKVLTSNHFLMYIVTDLIFMTRATNNARSREISKGLLHFYIDPAENTR